MTAYKEPVDDVGPRPPQGSGSNGKGRIRVVTASIQSDSGYALEPEHALEDLIKNADGGDIVVLTQPSVTQPPQPPQPRQPRQPREPKRQPVEDKQRPRHERRRPARHERAGQERPGRERKDAPATYPPANEKVLYGTPNPKTVDWKTRAALEEAERRLGYPLTVVQGSYNAGGVSASAGTHDRGGVVDLLAWDHQRKVRVLRAVGFAAWYRPTLPGEWNEHIHAVLIDHGNLAPSAARQVEAYRNGRDGLAGNRVDPTWHPKPIPVFQYPPRQRPDEPEVRPRQDDRGDDREDTPSAPPIGTPFPPRRTLDGVDISHHQGGRIDLTRARRAGVKWMYVKATEGSTVVDEMYRKRVKQARSADLPVGAYHFARPDAGDAAQEARFFLENADIRAGDMRPMLDLESLEGMSPAAVSDWTGVWVQTVADELRRRGLDGRPIIYTNFDLDDGHGCLLWVARYSDDFRAPEIPKPWKRAAIWQHSDGRFGPVRNVPGFGPVDANAVHPEVPMSALRVRPKRNRAADPPTPRPPRPTTERPGSDELGAALDSLGNHLRAAVRDVDAVRNAIPER